MDSILRRGNPLEKTGEKTREKTRVKPREKAPTREVIGKFWVRGNNVNNAARAHHCAAGDARKAQRGRSGMAALSVSVSFPINPFCHKVSKWIIYFWGMKLRWGIL